VLCFRCGSYNQDGTTKCDVCGQIFVEKTGRAPPVPEEKAKEKAPIGLLAKGEVIAGRYRVKDVLGQGGVGAVYRVRDEEIGADVALKAIFSNLLQTDEERKLFSRQIKLARKLHHPNIVRIYDEGQDAERRFFTMKLLEGLTLRKIIRLRHDKGQAFTPEEMIPIFHQLGAALDYAHKTTWHGDLKPENIIILPDLLKVTDFNLVKGLPLKPFLGIAKSKNKGFPYIAPELRVEASRIDGRADIYSLGVVLCEMLTGIVFEGHFTRAITAALERLPTKLDGLVRRALSEHPDGRFAKASEMATELEAALNALTSGALPIPPGATPPDDERSKKSKQPPPPPEETRPGDVKASDTAEERGRLGGPPPNVGTSDANDPSLRDHGLSRDSRDDELEELRPSQVMLLDTGVSKALADSRIADGALLQRALAEHSDPSKKAPPHPEYDDQEDIRTRPGGPLLPPEETVTPVLDAHRRKFRAEDLIETLYSSDDDKSLIPPPLPIDGKLDASSSFDSLPGGVLAVPGADPRRADALPFHLDGPTLADDDNSNQESEEEPTLSDHGAKLRIHDELTALKNKQGPALVPKDAAPRVPSPRDDEPPPLPAVHDDDDDEDMEETLGPGDLRQAQERSSPRLRAASPLGPPIVSPIVQEPTLRRLRPVAPPIVKKRPPYGIFIAGGVLAIVAFVAVLFVIPKTSGIEVPATELRGPGFASIGPAGGVVELDGVSLDVPADAVASDVVLRITRSDEPPPSGYTLFSPVYRFSPSGTRFEKPVRVSIPFTGDEGRAGLFWSDDVTPYRRLEGAIAGNSVSALVTHFSTGFVGVETPEGAVGENAATDAGAVVALQTDPVVPANPDQAAIDRAKLEDAKRLEEEARRLEDQKRLEAERQKAEDDKRREEAARKADAPKSDNAERDRKDAEAKARAEMEARERDELKKREADEKKREADEKKREADEKKREADEKKREADEKRKADEEKKREAEEKKKAEEEKRKADDEKKLAALAVNADVEKKCPKGMVMIKAGSFTMGSSPSDPMRNFGEKDAASVTTATYCIDYYEYPNSKSQPPATGLSYNGAKSACERKGRRLCTEAEWERACKGPSNARFPYGNTYDATACNTEDESGTPRAVGAAVDFKRCKSGFTVFSLAGNAEEWTADDFKGGGASKVVKGGAADRPDWASRCAARRGLSPGSSKTTLGVRCCADPQ
jgi:serine/threonine protein kinase/formylglycine-generating enzyme required for sulfatase activity